MKAYSMLVIGQGMSRNLWVLYTVEMHKLATLSHKLASPKSV